MRVRHMLLVAAATWWALAVPALAGEYDLVIEEKVINITGAERTAKTINGSVPGPALRWREGEDVTVRVTNRLGEPTSIHWHGLIVPAAMDGVPGVSFDGIAPGESFTYRFTVKQSGTYWYHSHSGLQEQSGVYAPLIIEPARKEPYRYDREHVVMLSEWTDEDPDRVFAKLKKQSGYYNFGKRTVFDFFRDVRQNGWSATVSDRLAWARMRMDPTDIADVSGSTYTFLVNGQPPAANWTALFTPGERVRLRLINAGAATYFDVRIPGLALTVVAADGQDVEPVVVDELRLAVSETYDVIVEPGEARAYTIFAEAMDRSGYARATLAPRPGMSAAIPALRPRPVRTMADMGMDHGAMDGAKEQEGAGAQRMGHGAMGTGEHGAQPGVPPADHGAMGTQEHARQPAPQDHGAMPGMAHGAAPPDQAPAVPHGPDTHGRGNSMVAAMPRSRLHEAGVGLENTGTRVLRYTDLRSREPYHDRREPGREIELHLTGNMERYVWGFDGKRYSESEPVPLRYGERVRFTLVNDTMMEHPIHLHGMWMELDNGNAERNPRKFTVNVKPGERVSFLVTADAPGDWVFHCHLLYHLDAGMMLKIAVSERPQ
ncbi:MAG: copper resistance system multicopper oxidase [Candidatus Rokubacteria bacterium]|nr:copper resistance system multicopper oxidase [Candidatus Rokubacteria bacterium]